MASPPESCQADTGRESMPVMKTILPLMLLALLAVPGSAEAGRRDDAFNRVVLIIDTSCSMRASFKPNLRKMTEVLPSLVRFREDELVVIALNGEPDLVWDSHAIDLAPPESGGAPEAWTGLLEALEGADAKHTDLTATMQLLATVLERRPSAETQYVFLFSDLLDDPAGRRSTFDLEQDVPWAALEGHALHLLGVHRDVYGPWMTSMAEHGLETPGGIEGGSVVSPVAVPHWRPTPIERAEEEVSFDNPWEGRGTVISSVAVSALKWGGALLGLGLLALFGLVTILGRSNQAAPPARRRSPDPRGRSGRPGPSSGDPHRSVRHGPRRTRPRDGRTRGPRRR